MEREKRETKIIFLLLVFVLVFSCFWGCTQVVTTTENYVESQNYMKFVYDEETITGTFGLSSPIVSGQQYRVGSFGNISFSLKNPESGKVSRWYMEQKK